jgi:D-glycerate 3-kinase
MALPPMDPLLQRDFALPMLRQLAALVHQGARPWFGLNGPVGAGKSLFCRQLMALAEPLGLRLAVASIDDFYLPWPQRQQAMAGNPFGVNRVPPGSHDVPLVLDCLRRWRTGGLLQLPRFDKTLRGGEGDRKAPNPGSPGERVDALVIEGWLMGCRPLGLAGQSVDRFVGLTLAHGQPPLRAEEAAWLPTWDQHLAVYAPLWDSCDGLWLIRPGQWGYPRRWRFQAEARQRRRGGAWLAPDALDRLVRASLASLPPALYQEPLSFDAKASALLNGRRQCLEVSGPAA